jgi:hypothetical protein
LLNFVFIYF